MSQGELCHICNSNFAKGSRGGAVRLCALCLLLVSVLISGAGWSA